MSQINQLTEKINQIRDDREWRQFHTPKNLAMSVAIEAGELLEEFQWLDDKELKNISLEKKSKIGLEIADVLIYLLMLSDDLEIDVMESIKAKLNEVNKKYPIEKSKGRSTKYNQL